MRRKKMRAAAGLVACAIATCGRAQFGNSAKLYGSVSDESGQGVANVRLILDPVEAGSKVEIVTKGKKGSYFFGIIRPGTYRLRVEAGDNALVSIKAHAKIADVQRREEEWTLDGRVNPEKPPALRIDDGMEITCDLVVGKAVALKSASGETTMASPDQAYALLAQQVQKGDCAGAVPQLDAFTASNSTYARAFYLLGYCHAVLDQNDAAIAALQKSAELDPAFAGTQTTLGKVYAREKKYPESEAAFQKELENTAAPKEVQIDALLGLGSVLRDQKKSEGAIAAFQKVIVVDPSRPEPYVELAGLYSDAGQLDKAESILTDAKTAGADDPAALLHVGITYFNKKDWPHAESMCRRVIDNSKASNADLASAYAILGRVQLNNGKTDDGVASLKKSIELDPAGRFSSQSEDILKALKSSTPSPKKK